MTQNKIYLSLTQEDKTSALRFINSSNIEKEFKLEGEFIEILLKLDDKDKENTIEITEEITNLIIDVMKENTLREYIDKQYSDTYPNEEECIYKYSLNLFKEKEHIIRSSIYKKVYNYILNNDYINIDGFVKFRMKEFMKYISTIVDSALEEYLMQKDQTEFINVLKYFIDIQEEKIDLLKVHIMNDNTFILYDKEGNKIENIDDEEIINMAIKENLNYEDFLISTLLTLCPKKIEILDTLNNNSSKEIVDTIRSIFEDKVKIIYNN